MRKYPRGATIDSKLKRLLSICIIPASMQIARLWKYPATDANIVKLLRDHCDKLRLIYHLYCTDNNYGDNEMGEVKLMSVDDWFRLLSDAAIVDGAMD